MGWGSLFPRKRFVFTNAVGNPIDMDKLNRTVNTLTTKAGIGRRTNHDFRHASVTLMGQAGVPIKVIQEWHGHSEIGTTLDMYTHLNQADLNQGLNALTNLLT